MLESAPQCLKVQLSAVKCSSVLESAPQCWKVHLSAGQATTCDVGALEGVRLVVRKEHLAARLVVRLVPFRQHDVS